MTEPRSEAWTASTPAPLGEDESGFTDEELDALNLDDDAPVENMKHVRKIRAQNQRMRHRLREAEANRQAAEEAHERDLAKLADLERREIERAAAEVLADPTDLLRFADEAEQQSFNDEFGSIVADNVVAAAHRLAAERPHLAKRAFPPPTDQPVEGLKPGASPESKPKPTSWQTAIRG